METVKLDRNGNARQPQHWYSIVREIISLPRQPYPAVGEAAVENQAALHEHGGQEHRANHRNDKKAISPTSEHRREVGFIGLWSTTPNTRDDGIFGVGGIYFSE